MLSVGIHMLLAQTKAITDAVSNRIYPVTLPIDTLVFPAITYQVISDSPEYDFNGIETDYQRVQINVWDSRYLNAKLIIESVKTVLTGFTGLLPNNINVITVEKTMEHEDFQTDPRVYRSIVEFRVTF